MVRDLRSKRRGLSPRKIIFVYFAAFLLVAFHQSGRVAEWFEGQADGGQGLWSDISGSVAAFIHEKIEPLGPAGINRAEDELLALPPDISVGAVEEASARQVTAPRPAPRDTGAAVSVAPAPPDKPGADLALSMAAGALNILTLLPAAPENFNPASVLLLGDSMMLEGLGPPLERSLKKFPGLSVKRAGRYGTGLCRLDVFDWLTYFKDTLAEYQPELVIITLGANDPQDIVNVPGRKKRIDLGSDEWKQLYGERVTALLAMAEAVDAKVFWVGLPIMGREPYGSRVADLNKVVADSCAAGANCRFWDAWLSVADENGQYSVQGKDAEGKTVRVRAKDSIHLTEKGGEIMAAKFLAETAGWAAYEQKGTVSEHSFASALRRKETKYFVAAPRLTGQAKLPAVFLLHGAWDGPQAWLDNMGREELAALAQANNILIIMPDGDPFGWYLDGPEAPIESYFMQELLPRVLAEHPADKDRLAVSGLSMGGHGALTLAMKHPGVFKAVSSISGVTDLSAHGNLSPLNQSINIHKVLGAFAENSAAWLKSSAAGLSGAQPESLKGLPLFISVGLADDLTLAENRRYHQLLEELKIVHEYREEEGGHDWGYWSGQLPAHLEFLAGHLKETGK